MGKACHQVITKHNDRVIYFSPVISYERASNIAEREVQTVRDDITRLYPHLEEVPDMWQWYDPAVSDEDDPIVVFEVSIVNTKYEKGM